MYRYNIKVSRPYLYSMSQKKLMSREHKFVSNVDALNTWNFKEWWSVQQTYMLNYNVIYDIQKVFFRNAKTRSQLRSKIATILQTSAVLVQKSARFQCTVDRISTSGMQLSPTERTVHISSYFLGPVTFYFIIATAHLSKLAIYYINYWPLYLHTYVIRINIYDVYCHMPTVIWLRFLFLRYDYQMMESKGAKCQDISSMSVQGKYSMMVWLRINHFFTNDEVVN